MLSKEKEEKQNFIILFLIVSCLGLFIRTLGLSWISDDMRICLTVWMDELEGGKGFSSLASYTGDYNMPYITVLWLIARLPISRVAGVKAFSILFDYIGAMLAGLIAEHFYQNRFLIAYTLVLLSPITMANSAWWGQCDMVYTAFLLGMLYLLLKEKYPWAMVALGCAFSFKLQAIFLLPFILIYYWKTRKFSLVQFLLVPVTMVILCVPAILGRHSPMVAFNVYARQTGRYPYLFVSYPNIWTFFEESPYYRYRYAGIAAMLILLGIFAYYVIREKKTVSNKRWLEYAFVTVAIEMAFLPCMHERYGFLLEILAILMAVITPSRWWIAVGYYIPTVCVYIWQQFYHPFPNILPIKWVALLYLMVFTAVLVTFVGEERREPERWIDEERMGRKKLFIEGPLLDQANKVLFPVLLLITAALSIYVKRMPSDYTAPSFLADFLEQEGNVHTAVYMMGIRLLTYLPGTPVLILKTMIACMDVVLAYIAGCFGADCNLLIAFRYGKASVTQRMRFLTIYGLLLMLPPLFENGVLWVHVDCLCMTLFLLAWMACKKGHGYLATILYGTCTAVQFHYIWFLPMILLLLGKQEKDQKKQILGMSLLYLGVLILLPLPALGLGYSVPELYGTYIRSLDITGASGIGIYNFGSLWPQQSLYALLISVATYILLLLWQIQVGGKRKPLVLLCWGYLAAVVFLPSMLQYYAIPALILLIILALQEQAYAGIVGAMTLLLTLTLGEYLYDRGRLFSPLLYAVCLIGIFLLLTRMIMKPIAGTNRGE